MPTTTRQTIVQHICYTAAMSAIMLVAQVALAALPNIELVSLFVVVFTMYNPRLARAAIAVFVLMQGILYGFHTWWVTYIYVWYILHFIVFALRRHASPLLLSLVGAIYGLLFGVLCSPIYFFTLGIGGGISWIIAGAPFDIAHCIGNLLSIFILYRPLMRLSSMLPLQPHSAPS